MMMKQQGLQQEECQNFNLDPDTFKHDNPAYQEIASSSNAAAEQLLGLVHTQSSMLHSKEALKSIPEGEEEEEGRLLCW